ncbi:hypothetical protein ACVOMV_13490 [Mesorhizobium atlanticum]
MTTISSFGGSAAAKVQASAASLVSAATKGSDEPKFKTVIVTRGEKVEEYKVPSREPPQELQQQPVGTGGTGTTCSGLMHFGRPADGAFLA